MFYDPILLHMAKFSESLKQILVPSNLSNLPFIVRQGTIFFSKFALAELYSQQQDYSPEWRSERTACRIREWKTGQDAIPALPYILEIKKAKSFEVLCIG